MSEVDHEKPAEAGPPEATCNECGRKIALCTHMASNMMMLSSLGEEHNRIKSENERLKVKIEKLEGAIDAARPAIKWVINHWGRRENSEHDLQHAKLALSTLEGTRAS